jgi:hypothetical protein
VNVVAVDLESVAANIGQEHASQPWFLHVNDAFAGQTDEVVMLADFRVESRC